jgi:hypothetical protein
VWQNPDGNLNSPVLWCGGGERKLDTNWYKPDNKWNRVDRALVSRNLFHVNASLSGRCSFFACFRIRKDLSSVVSWFNLARMPEMVRLFDSAELPDDSFFAKIRSCTTGPRMRKPSKSRPKRT